jgi:hypothetical protein
MRATETSISRRAFLGLGTVALSLALSPAKRAARAAVTFPSVTAYRNPGCGCCEKWSEQMKASGFTITMQDDENLASRKTKLGVPEQIAGCHTALIGDYVIEGHVPPDDIILFLAENSGALGLAVAGMPTGSPGMESGESKDPYDVFVMAKDGSWKVYAKH